MCDAHEHRTFSITFSFPTMAVGKNHVFFSQKPIFREASALSFFI